MLPIISCNDKNGEIHVRVFKKNWRRDRNRFDTSAAGKGMLQLRQQ